MESENSENEKFRVKIGKIASWKIRVWRGQNLDREKGQISYKLSNP